MLAISLKSPTLPFICSWVTFMHILHAHSPKLTTGKKILKLGVFGLYQAMPLICSRICDSFPGHCHWQLVAKSNKMFNKPHVLSFLALPLYPCGCEPETEPRLPPVRCNFACVLCVHMCSQFHIFLSCSRVSWRNVLSWTEQLGTEFWKGKKTVWDFFCVEGEGALFWGHSSREKEGGLSWWMKATNISVPAQVGQKERTACCATWYLPHLWCCCRLLNARYCCYVLKEKERKIKIK